MGGLQPRLRASSKSKRDAGEGLWRCRIYRPVDSPLVRFLRSCCLSPGRWPKDLPSLEDRPRTRRLGRASELVDLGSMSLGRPVGGCAVMCLRHVCPLADTWREDPCRGGRDRGLVSGHDVLRRQAYRTGRGGSAGPPEGPDASRAPAGGVVMMIVGQVAQETPAIHPCLMNRVHGKRIETVRELSARPPLDKILHRHVIPTPEPERHAELFLLSPVS